MNIHAYHEVQPDVLRADSERHVGQSVQRLEDPPLVQGQARFAGDINFPHQLHMRIVRAQVAHGRILHIDTEAARAMPGVIAIWTGKDVADIPPIPFRATTVQGLEPYCQPILAQDYVRYVGEPVAAVFAVDAYLAEDAADLIWPDIDPLPVVLDASGEVGEFLPGYSTEPTIIRKGYGDVDAAFAQAHAVVELDLSIGRHSGVPLECRGAIGRYDAARDVLEMYGAAKKTHWNRDEMAKMLNRSPSKFHLHGDHVGGGFGVRGELYPEDVLVCLAALRLRRAIKWIEDRREHLMATNHSRQQRHQVKAAVDADGRILGIRNTLFHDNGGYVRTHGPRVADMSAGLLLGPYRVPAYAVEAHYRLTNKTPCGTYRSPGRYETTFVRERLMDAIAHRVGIDVLEVRRRNLIGPEEMPYARPLDALGTDVVLDSGNYALLLDKTLDRIGWAEAQADIARRKAAGEVVGIGLAMFVEKSGLGPSDGVRITVDTAGDVELVTGAASVGQGMETALAQICADGLGIDYRRVRVVHGRTDQIAFGNGAHASRVTVMSGSATQIAAAKLRAKAIDIGAEMLGLTPEELDMTDGHVHARGVAAGRRIGLQDIARHVHAGSRTVGRRDPGLTAEGWFYSDHMNYPYGIHVAQIRIDAGSGQVEVERYLVSYDVGRAVNPMLIDGQIVGGLAQGLGGALFEEFTYDETGQPLSTTFADYLLVTAHEMPASVDVLITEDAPSPLNPMGMKGAGEGGTNAVGAAIAAAVDDALGQPGFVTRLPVLPAAIHRALARRT
ncbi:xanthine dehydrogenase family protein molybdopterin-binding subunit [Pigmentiphaga litoralis]|uniref:Carbon-monoxide dehydrogenase large subunit/6-hydroxypseudooxynicotine dehydrogenase subunit gamma n=1 Tax=Pigmentiphaga litoralis TaxID=516702 RepID=A0A7Y9IRS3_9BURK|nr:xanthine dehydrogenase family protein molybdopterin-binding subunit [Pigmentiphaga litoralis]NYE24573.1 carbon-monoxide dehydrogenase large subunit/6-hydroxypseudooxynicotine dehydrogenase subunit gamma [Pigmentiphaga litoralis]NYE81813.1 carbon-monoxide dehydrogenase large subunit/6-hydroxypseudooxynicotine dehydrogenase subunit gamma [Pigmentiphaga litoralis]